MSKKYSRSYIVFEGYDNGPYVRDHIHKRRTGKMSAFISLDNLEMIPTFKQEVFLKNEQNKSQFKTSNFSCQMRCEEKETMSETVLGDADTQIVSAALEYAKDNNKDVVVVAADTYFRVLLVFHWKKRYASLHAFRCTSRKEDKETWRIEDLPIMTDFSGAPDNILRVIRCNCNISKISHVVPMFVAAGDVGFHVFPLVVIAMVLSVRIFHPEEVSSDEESVGSDEDAHISIFDILDVSNL
ncbi:unnamed protein product [Lepeophtheirus salmonis]|uniref:(salmon louse) hypothetical protein n=1 Tax=Lepeophtheirus salmonis TaxID=72036 RepID=A0A7R8CT76_LEPSM|nr:unnamed protein product [Lepeophtheirus salmonis]CAF2871097.1 unnamed protein product [Lepeophtheirus salmonis]